MTLFTFFCQYLLSFTFFLVAPTIIKSSKSVTEARPAEPVEVFVDIERSNPLPTITWFYLKCLQVRDSKCIKKDLVWTQIIKVGD